MHMNDAFAKFIRINGLTSKTGVQSADPNLEFPKGAVELKAAWQIVADGDHANYITARASVPALKIAANKVVIDTAVPSREVTVALLSIHVVFVLEGHPEFVWATFEHVGKDHVRDLAPDASALPSENNGLPGGIDGPISSGGGFSLYKAGTLASEADRFQNEATMASAFDEKSQRFNKGGTTLQTSIYRLFPGSKTSDINEDDDITDLNKSIQLLFEGNAKSDLRANYRLVGAVWLDKPEVTFAANKKFANPPGTTTDDPGATVAGEDGLSSMAMESFTQNSFVNCFSCHDTRAVKDFDGNVLLAPKKLNVSHILSKFVSESK